MSDLTPMMKQYLDIKKKNPDAILFFRLGDFYEMFGEDAKTAAVILQIALTSRGAGEGRQNKIPMCGVPFHAANNYIMKLINAGKKVAICEQTEDPKFAKGIVRREVVKIITPGTVMEDAALDRKTNKYITSVFAGTDTAATAVIDLSTGEFSVAESDISGGYDGLADYIEKTCCAETLLPASWKDDKVKEKELISRLKSGTNRVFVNFYPDWNYEHDMAYEKLKEHFKTINLEGFGIEGKRCVISAAGSLLSYLYETQKTALHHINRLSFDPGVSCMHIDAVSLRNLEITEAAQKNEGITTLYSVLDNTFTPMGARELKKWLRQPLLNAEKIKERLDCVGVLNASPDARKKLSEIMTDIADMERIAGKLGNQTVNGRDLNALKRSIEQAEKLNSYICAAEPFLASKFVFYDIELSKTAKLIAEAIVEEPPIAVKEGGIIREQYSPELKQLQETSSGAREWLAHLQENERKRTGIGSLKVGYTSVFGYYIEISKANAQKTPCNYIRKQTLVNAERFITPELKEYESAVLNSQEKQKALEYEVFCAVRDKITLKLYNIQCVSAEIARLDCLLSLAEAAVTNGYIRPDVGEYDTLTVKEGRHPVIEKTIGYNEFIPNDTELDTKDNMIMMITGPNMAGKSTYMRQTAVIAVMAQAGSFVPAKEAKIGIIDRIFTRVGAADYLARGQSTFMVEMIETANILNNATPRSLILLDEVGRGTSTFDGVSIAWAITEYIQRKIKAKTLFATHYFELTELEALMPGIKNHNVQVKEWGDKIVFLRKIVRGSADRSYGIHVAQLAGLPGEIISRAQEVLKDLENANYAEDGRPKIGASAQQHPKSAGQLDLFAPPDDRIKQEIEKLDVDNLTPIEALVKLKEIKEKYST